MPALTLVALGAALGADDLAVGRTRSRSSPERCAIDGLSLVLNVILVAGGACDGPARAGARGPRAKPAHGEFHALLLDARSAAWRCWSRRRTLSPCSSALELLSIPLYVLCATEMRREHSLESGLKYLIIGSVGSATLLYGIALLYGATGATDFAGSRARSSSAGLASDALLLTGHRAVRRSGLCFKASVAPFHQWTPDVYEGAPTPITAFMAVATKVAALGVFCASSTSR